MKIANILTIIFLCFATASLSVRAAPQAGDPAMAEKASIALMTALKLDRDTPSAKEITNLILQERYEEFEKRSKFYEDKFLEDPAYESPLRKFYGSIESAPAFTIDKIDAWIKKRPSYISYTARGIYKAKAGFNARGTKFIQDTPLENLEKMEKFHQEAKSDLLYAIKQKPTFLPAYIYLVRIEKTSGSLNAREKALDLALKAVPSTYYVRYEYLQSLLPRWGGSYALMTKFADDWGAAAKLNPRIWSLKGEAAADLGNLAKADKNYGDAVRYYTEALSYGDRSDFLIRRGAAYSYLKKYDLSLKDYMQYQKYRPSDSSVNDYIESLQIYLQKPPADGKQPSAPAE